MTNTKAVQIVNADRLNPFDQEYLDYFTEFSNKSVDEKLSELHGSHEMFKFYIQKPSLHKEPIMTKVSAVQVRNAKRLKPFDQEDRDYFSEFSSKPINEKLRELHDSHGMLYRQIDYILQPRLCTNDAEAAKSIARLSRMALRDIKHYELALMNHLELIEVTGEWK